MLSDLNWRRVWSLLKLSGGVLARSTAPARRPGPWERTRMGTSGSAIKTRAQRQSGWTEESDR